MRSVLYSVSLFPFWCARCSISDGDFCEGTGDGGHRVWCAVSAYRGLVLLWNRVSVSAVRILPGNQQSTDVSGTYGDLSGLRVVLAYILSVPLKASGIWVAIVNHKNLKEI